MIDQTNLKKLQIMYLLTRSDTIYIILWEHLKHLAINLSKKMLRKTGYNMQEDIFENVVDDITFRFMSMYLKNPAWYCSHFSTRLAFDVRFVLYSDQVKLTTLDVNLVELENKKESTATVLEDIISDTKYWRNVLINCYRSRSYKAFILSIQPIVGKSWIYDHAKRLKNLYKNTRIK